MIDLTLLVVVICSFISSVYAQEVAVNAFPGFQPLDRPGLVGLGSGQPQAPKRKPCARRRMNNQIELLVPAPHDQRLQNAIIQSTGDRNGNLDDFDCDIDLNASNDAPKEFAVGLPLATMSKPSVERKVIELLKDCADNKQKIGNDGQENQGDLQLLMGSRRSMGSNDYNENPITEEDDERSRSANTGTVAGTVAQNPKKVLNGLQNPEVSEIGEVGISRSVQDGNDRVCYACSSASNPTCWSPDARTTIKYCRPNQQCVTKAFGEDDSFVVIRDCAYSCGASSVPGVEPKYKQCNVCNEDLCNIHDANNGAIINTYNLAFMLVIAAATVKCTI